MTLKESAAHILNHLAAGISMRLEGVTETQVNFAKNDPGINRELTRIFAIPDLSLRSREFRKYFNTLNAAQQTAINRMFTMLPSKKNK